MIIATEGCKRGLRPGQNAPQGSVGSFYQSPGSQWYFLQAYELTEHGKYLLMAPSKDRSGTLGFHCVREAE
jgi:hypothetical protein